MGLQAISFGLVSLGILLLFYALIPTRSLCREPQQARGWIVLLVLILFFIAGYSVFAWRLWFNNVSLIELSVALILFGGSCFVVLVVRMSERSIHYVKRIAALERHNALHDELTTLPNRTLLYQRIDQALAAGREQGNKVAMLLMDLDRFKEINDTLGHHVGDRILQQVAPRLHASIRETDTVARLGGDEFAIVLPCSDIDTAIALSHRVIEAMKKPFPVEQHNLKVNLSIGICLFPEHGEDRDTLLQRADVAMYNAKSSSTGYAIYDAEQDMYSLHRLKLTNELQQAITNNILQMHYQPIIDVSTRRLHGVEALVRWPHGDMGFIPACDFIPLAEQTGLIQQITRWALATTIEQLAIWQEQDIRCKVSVNLSIKDLQNPDLPSLIDALLREWDVPGFRLTLEITEGSVMTDLQQVYEVLMQLSRMGVSIAVDDFGTGYSSLTHLRQMPVSVIKIDQSFILDMIEDDNDAVIVRSTIDLAHNMGKKVIAEGVENQDILDILEILRCDMVQGFHFAQPMPVDEFQDWLAEFNRQRG